MKLLKLINYILKNYKNLENEVYFLKEENKYLKSRIKALNKRISSLDTKIYQMDDFIDTTLYTIKD